MIIGDRFFLGVVTGFTCLLVVIWAYEAWTEWPV